MNLPTFNSPFAGNKLLQVCFKESKSFQNLSHSVQYFFIQLLQIADWSTYDFFLSYKSFKTLAFSKISKRSYCNYMKSLRDSGLIIQMTRGNSFTHMASNFRINLCLLDMKSFEIFLQAIDEQGLLDDLKQYYMEKYKIDITVELKNEYEMLKSDTYK